MDPRVNSHTAYSEVHVTPDTTYYIRHTKATEIGDYYPILIFGMKQRSGAKYEMIPETGTPSSTWEQLRVAASTPDAFYKYNGKHESSMQIAACPQEVLFITDGEPGICPRGRIQMFVPAFPAIAWFRIARDVVGVYEIESAKNQQVNTNV